MTKIFRGEDWYLFLDDQFTFGYRKGILSISTKDIVFSKRFSEFGTPEVSVFINHIEIIIKKLYLTIHNLHVYFHIHH